MVELLTAPPPGDVINRLVAIPGVRITPTVLASQEGPEGQLGPEAAGAILMLQATFVDEAKAAEFWNTVAGLLEQLAAAPGFIRRWNFTDGPHYTLIALWRSAADARAFAASPGHEAAMRDLYQHRWQFSHFAALWERHEPGSRVIFCSNCDGVTPAAEATCRGCGTELFDPFRSSEPGPG
jgi:heme-degrading monooxygenase HmoA